MPQLGTCLVLEWGWPFLVGALLVALLVLSVLVLIIWKFRGRMRINFDKWGFTVQDLDVTVVVILGALVAIGCVTYWGYGKFRTSYSATLDSPVLSRELDEVREKLQNETQATIIINDAAKKFLIKGHYEGACVQDLFDSVCRQYSSQLSCNTSLRQRTLTVDLKSSH